MGSLTAHKKDIKSIFELMGSDENDITKSIAWVLYKCPSLLKILLQKLFSIEIDPTLVIIHYQKYDSKKGITDLEITDNCNFFIIIEAKRGWILPSMEQLNKYAEREDFMKCNLTNKAIVSLSECSREYADCYLPKKTNNNLPIKHVSWAELYNDAEEAKANSNNEQKHLLDELLTYLKGIMTMQQQDSNWVYVVSLSNQHYKNCSLSYIDIVNKHNKYFCPVGLNGFPKESPNYVAFRYNGKLQGIYHIDSYIITKRIHKIINEWPDEEAENHFVFNLGPVIKPTKEVKTGNIYPSGRVWAMLDTLLTCNSISEARDLSNSRLEKK